MSHEYTGQRGNKTPPLSPRYLMPCILVDLPYRKLALGQPVGEAVDVCQFPLDDLLHIITDIVQRHVRLQDEVRRAVAREACT